MVKRYIYTALVIKVVDGDTVVVVDLGFRIKSEMRVRLYGIDTPEINSSVESERLAANTAKVKVQSMILGQEVYIETFKVDKYGRYLAKIFLDSVDGITLNDVLVEHGLAKPYFGGAR